MDGLSDPDATLSAGLFALVASLVGSVGAIACVVGQLFTLPHGHAVLAGVAHRCEERVAGRRATPAAVAQPHRSRERRTAR